MVAVSFKTTPRIPSLKKQGARRAQFTSPKESTPTWQLSQAALPSLAKHPNPSKQLQSKEAEQENEQHLGQISIDLRHASENNTLLSAVESTCFCQELA